MTTGGAERDHATGNAMFDIVPALTAKSWTALSALPRVALADFDAARLSDGSPSFAIDCGTPPPLDASRLRFNTDRFRDNPALSFIHTPRVPVPPMRLYVLKDVFVHTGCWLIARPDGATYTETVPPWNRNRMPAVLAERYVADRTAAGFTESFTEPVGVFQNMVQWSYSHWHWEALAGLEMLESFLPGMLPNLTGRGMRLHNYHGPTLRHFARHGRGFRDVDGIVRCRTAVVPSIGFGQHIPIPHTLAALDRIRVGEGIAQEPRDMVYVARFDAPDRRGVINERELADRLAGLGFVILEPSPKRHREQVATLAAARVVIGPHGAGLINLGFARPGATLVEIHPSDYPVASFFHLAAARGDHAHCYFVEPSEGAGQTSRIRVDVEDFVRTLRDWGII